MLAAHGSRLGGTAADFVVCSHGKSVFNTYTHGWNQQGTVNMQPIRRVVNLSDASPKKKKTAQE